MNSPAFVHTDATAAAAVIVSSRLEFGRSRPDCPTGITHRYRFPSNESRSTQWYRPEEGLDFTEMFDGNSPVRPVHTEPQNPRRRVTMSSTPENSSRTASLVRTLCNAEGRDVILRFDEPISAPTGKYNGGRIKVIHFRRQR